MLKIHARAETAERAEGKSNWGEVVSAYESLLATLKSLSHGNDPTMKSLQSAVLKNLSKVTLAMGDRKRSLSLFLETAEIDETDIGLWIQVARLAGGFRDRTYHRLERHAWEVALKLCPTHSRAMNGLQVRVHVYGYYLRVYAFLTGGNAIYSCVIQHHLHSPFC